MLAMRRVGLLSQHLTAAPAAGSGSVGEDIRQILEALGPYPIETMSKKMTYKFKYAEIPSLQERGYKNMPDVVAKIAGLSPSTEEVGSMGVEADALQVAKALLFYAADALDEAHLSALRISMAKKYAGSDSMTKADANYCHALLHRTEGEILGPEGISDEDPEGLSGWKNAVGWFGRTKEAAKGPHPLYPTVLAKVREIAKTTKMGNAGGMVGVKLSEILKEGGQAAWDPDVFVEFCKAAMAEKDPESLEFVREVINAEWKILLDSCLTKANIQVSQVAKTSA